MFQPIHDNVKGKRAVLEREAQFSRAVQRILQSVYPEHRALRVVQAKRDGRTKRLTVTVSCEHHAVQLARDLELIRAAFRREGIDARSVVVEQA